MIKCASFSRIAISETPVRPPLSDFTYTCNQSGSELITYNLSDTTEGSRTLYFWSYSDADSKYSESSSVNFILDQTPPSGTVSNPPSLVRGGTSQTLNLSQSDNILFDTYVVEFTDDGVLWSNVGTFNKDTTSALLNIPATDTLSGQVRVTLKDKAGNSQLLSTTTFTVDSTPPTLSLPDLGSHVPGGASQTVNFSLSDANGVANWELQYASDGVNFTTIATNPTSPYTWSTPTTETTNGTLRLVATDNAGNPDNIATSPFIIDSSDPIISLSPIPSPLRGGSTTTLSYSVTDASPITSLTIEYAADGINYSFVATVTGSTSYAWSIPSDNNPSSRIRMTAVDSAGNTGSTVSNAFIVDSTAPSANLNNLAALIRGGVNQSITFTTSDTNTIASIALNFTSDGSTYSNVINNPTSPYTWSVPSINTTNARLQLIATDGAGNSTTVTNNSFTIDSTPPTINLSNTASLLQGGATESLTFSSSDSSGVASTSLEYAADGVNFVSIGSNLSSPYTWTIPSHDTTTAKLRFSATDNAGNTQSVVSSAFSIDSLAPVLSITDLPSIIRGGNSQSVTFRATDTSGFSNLIVEFAADGSTYSTLIPHEASSPYTWTIPTVDTTASRLRVSATDNAGNSHSVQTSPFSIDSTGPTITLSDLASVIRGGQNSSVSFTHTDPSGIRSISINYAADGTNFSSTIATNPTSPFTWSVPSHDTSGSKLQLMVSDSVGNWSTIENSAFSIDSTPPTLSLSNLPALLQGGATQGITFTNSDVNGVASLLLEYTVDGSTYTTISSTPTSVHSWTLPSADTTLAQVRLTGVDSVGNTASVSSNIFTIDSTAPSVDITDIPSLIRGGNTQSLTFSATDTSGISHYDLLFAEDGTTFTALQNSATSPHSWTIPVTDSSASRLRVIATDNAGNSASHTTSSFIIDSTAPTLSLSDLATVIRGGINNDITHTKSDLNGIASSELFYSTDGVFFTSITTNPALTQSWTTPLVDLTTARIRLDAVDNAGNSASVTNTLFEIDSTPPTGSISTPPSPILGGSTTSVTFSTVDSNGIGSIALQYAADGTNFTQTLSTTNSSPYSWTLPTVSTTGSKIRLVTTDSVGNQTLYESGAFNIDATPPSAPLLSLTSAVYTASTAVTFSASSCADTPFLFINESTAPGKDDAGWQACSTSANAITYTLPTTEGLHTLRAWSKDSVGNVSTTSTDFSVYYDVTNPSISVSNPGLMRGGATYPLNWTVTEASLNNTRSFNVEYFNGTTWQSIASIPATTGPHTAQAFTTNWTAPSLNRTDIQIRVSLTDLAGNSTTTASTTFEIDSIAPALTITSPAANSYHLSSTVVTGSCETGRNVDFSGDLQTSFSVNCTGGSYSQTINFSDGDGTKNIVIAQSDAAGNTTTLNRDFIRDEVAPILTFSSGNNPDFTNQDTPNTWGGTCEANYPITITGDESTTINCSSGSWSWTPSPKTTDGVFSYNLVQTDAAGNTSSPPLTVSWERDATPPLFNLSSPLTIANGSSGTDTNNLDQRTLSGSCEGTNTIAITGEESTFLSCSASSFSWTTSSFTTDATRTYNLSQTDSAGNTSTLTYTWVRDTTGPGLTLSDNNIHTNTDTATFSGNCEVGENITITGAESATITCPSGTWSWTTATQTTDATRSYTFTQTFSVSPFNSTSVSGSWLRETNPPTISQFTTTASNPSNNAYIRINLQAASQNSITPITEICFTRLTPTAPTAGDSCWVGVDSPSVGLPLAQNLDLQNHPVLLGWETQSYDLYAWVKDSAGNMSSLTSAGSGTIGTDRITHSYDPGIAPVLSDIVAANINNSQLPPLRSESSVPAGTNVFIRWKVVDDTALPSGSVSLFYTTDDINYTAISTAQSLDPHSNQGCGSMTLAANEGCYLWNGGSPLNTPYKILVKATDSGDISTQGTSNNTNSDRIKIIAGNTEKGIGGSAQTAVFINEGTGDSVDPGTLVYTSDGRLFFADYDRGILTIDPATGKLIVFIPRTGSSTGDGGAAENATLQRAIKITLDYQGRLLIFDDTRIRRVDLNQETPTIETLIGGGTDKGDTVNNAQDVEISDMCDYCAEEDSMPFFAMPNGDIVFFSERPVKFNTVPTRPRLRIYRQATGQVISKYYTGDGDSTMPTQQLDFCRLSHFGLSFNSNSEFIHNLGFVQKSFSWSGCDSESGWRKVSYDPNTFATITPPDDVNRWWNRSYYTGMDGKLYVLSYGSFVNVVNSDGSQTRVLGTTTRGDCVDGTDADQCNINFKTIFVNTNGELFFVDRGAIRVIDANGKIKTILGQKKTYGDNVLAINSRFEYIRELTRRDNGDIVVIDTDGYLIKEFTPNGNIEVIAGNGNLEAPDLLLPADNNPGYIRNYIQVDRANGDIYASAGSHYGNVVKLDRASGNWAQVIGNGSGTHYDSADGLAGLSVDSGGNQNRGLPVGVNGNHLMLMRMKYNNTENRYGSFRLKAYDKANSFEQIHVLGGSAEYPASNDSRDVCDGANPGPVTATTCDAPYWDTFSNIDYDATNDRWIAAVSVGGNQRELYSIDMNADTIDRIGYTSSNIDDWYKYVIHADSSEVIYYCGGGRIRKYVLGGIDQGALSWPINNMYCRGGRADYNPTNNSLIFPFEQNGLYGVAEYFLD
ncbi:MAG: Ig-like domain-containing protein [Bdellovibrionota bacterium]|nr:Ig-like domain-containing protein [Bdellovibrionota bacterium]